MIEKIAITDSTVVDSIRKSIPVATARGNGLMPMITGRTPFFKYIELSAGNSIVLDFDYGIISLYSRQNGASWAFLINNSKVIKIASTTDSIIVIGNTAESKVKIYKLNENQLAIRNDSSSQFRFYIESL